MRPNWGAPPGMGGGGMGIALPTMTPVVKALVIANVAVFLVGYLFSGALGSLFALLAMQPGLWKGWFPFLPLWQLLTYGFLHAGPGHLLINMLMLYFLGTMLEGIVGSRRFLAFYLLAVALSGMVELSLAVAAGSNIPILGASGGVLAAVVAVATFRPDTRIIFILFPMTLRTLVLIYVAIDLLNVVERVRGGQSNVASFAHLTGAAVGFLAVRRGWIWRDPLASARSWRAERRRESAQEDQERLDRLLARIQSDGIGSLSARDRSFLKRMAKKG